jgi:hypothetical protein
VIRLYWTRGVNFSRSAATGSDSSRESLDARALCHHPYNPNISPNVIIRKIKPSLVTPSPDDRTQRETQSCDSILG